MCLEHIHTQTSFPDSIVSLIHRRRAKHHYEHKRRRRRRKKMDSAIATNAEYYSAYRNTSSAPASPSRDGAGGVRREGEEEEEEEEKALSERRRRASDESAGVLSSGQQQSQSQSQQQPRYHGDNHNNNNNQQQQRKLVSSSSSSGFIDDEQNREQNLWLEDALHVVKKHAQQMKRAIGENNLRDSLKNASAMLGELRTHQLSPKRYYDLFTHITFELEFLREFFANKEKHGRSAMELYELVQHAGNVLPRLYLLVCVGCVYVESREGKAKDVLRDLVEMAKGCQHPVHGLFLRAYLAQTVKGRGLLPDTGNELERSGGGTVEDSIEFTLSNFTEMNKLWVRMQRFNRQYNSGGQQRGSGGGSGTTTPGGGREGEGHGNGEAHGSGQHGGSVYEQHQQFTTSRGIIDSTQLERDRREKERLELRDIVGKNLTVLSQLEGVDIETYSENVLPRVLEQIVNCRDDVAQPYLMIALAQAFPSEYHLATCDDFLAAVASLKPTVQMSVIFTSLSERLSWYLDEPDLSEEEKTARRAEFDDRNCVKIFLNCAQEIAIENREMSALEIVQIYSSIADFALSQYPNDVNKMNEVLLGVAKAFDAHNVTSEDETRLSMSPQRYIRDQRAVSALVKLLAIPLEMFTVDVALSLHAFPKALKLLNPETAGRDCALAIVRGVLKSEKPLSDVKTVETLFKFIAPLLRDNDNKSYEMTDLNTESPLKRSSDLLDALSLREERRESAYARKTNETINTKKANNDGEEGYEEDAQFAEEQMDVAKLLHKIHCPNDWDSQLHLLKLAKVTLFSGGEKRMRFTLPALCYSSMRFAKELLNERELEERRQHPERAAAGKQTSSDDKPKRTLEELEVFEKHLQTTLKKTLQITHQSAERFSEIPGCAERGLVAWAEAGMFADSAKLSDISYEFFERAFETFDEKLSSDSRAQNRGLTYLIGALQTCVHLEEENRDALVHHCATFANRLLRRSDQCAAAANCAHLFWSLKSTAIRDSEGVKKCLNKALKIANQAARALGVSPGESLGLYAHVLNKHLYFFEIETCEAVDVETVQHLLDAIQEMIESGASEHGGTAAWRDAEQYFAKIKSDIKHKRKAGGVGDIGVVSGGAGEESTSQFAAERYRRLNL